MKKRRIAVWVVALLCCLTMVALVQAQNGFTNPASEVQAEVAAAAEPAVAWWVVAAGGGQATAGGGIVVQDTLGQPITGPASGDTAGLGAGFWNGGPANEYTVYLPIVLRNR